jgi:tetratricopeptide (TPR) repeat protein
MSANIEISNLFPDRFIDWAWARLVCYLGIAMSAMLFSFSFFALRASYNKTGVLYWIIGACVTFATMRAVARLHEVPTEYKGHNLEALYLTGERAEKYGRFTWHRARLIREVRHIDALIENFSISDKNSQNEEASYRTLYDRCIAAADPDYMKMAGDIALSYLTPSEAKRAYRQALVRYEDNGNFRGAAEALKGIGDADLASSAYKGAQIAYSRALELHRATDNLKGIADVLKALGDMEAQCANHREARNFYEDALWVYSRIEDEEDKKDLKNMLKLEHVNKDKIQTARALVQLFLDHADYKSAEEICVKEIAAYRNADSVAAFETMLGNVYVEGSRYADAWREYVAAIEHYRTRSDRQGELTVLIGLKRVITARFHLQIDAP